jgi:hypothetical protein
VKTGTAVGEMMGAIPIFIAKAGVLRQRESDRNEVFFGQVEFRATPFGVELRE